MDQSFYFRFIAIAVLAIIASSAMLRQSLLHRPLSVPTVIASSAIKLNTIRASACAKCCIAIAFLDIAQLLLCYYTSSLVLQLLATTCSSIADSNQYPIFNMLMAIVEYQSIFNIQYSLVTAWHFVDHDTISSHLGALSGIVLWYYMTWQDGRVPIVIAFDKSWSSS